MRHISYLILLVIAASFSFYIGTAAGDTYPPAAILDLIINDPEDELTIDNESPEEYPEEEPEPEPEPDLRSANMVVTGNIMTHVPQIEQAYIGDGKYDFSPSFEIITPYLQQADITVADLEVMQAGPDIVSVGWGVRGYTGFPEFNAPQELSEALYDAGINVFTLANNHALDRGYEGLMVTIDHVRGLGAETIGVHKTQEERNTPLILNKNGIDIALIAYTYGTNGIPVPERHEYCVNLVPDFNDITPVLKDIETARENGADLVAVFPHWGSVENSHEPQPQRLREVAEEMAAAGADLVIGGHPKFIQPIEWFFFEEEDGSERAAFAIYSQGNFLSNQSEAANNTPYVEYGLLLDIDISKNYDTGQTWISGIDYEITWVHRGWRHRVLPLSDVFNASHDEFNLNASQVERFENIYNTSIEVIERYGHPEDSEKAMAISNRHFEQAYSN